jgi:predicted alpha/beta hydrolase family esterase
METHKQQVAYMHGGTVFASYDAYLDYLRTREVSLDRMRAKRDWKDNLQTVLGYAFDVLAPRMPNGSNAVYAEWELWFSRVLPLLSDGVILIGHSLGGVFLARYLSEHRSPIRITATLLAAAPYFDDVPGESLGAFVPPSDLSLFREQGGALFVYHSTDDPVVPYAHATAYARALPGATFRTCEGLGHFTVPSFPELEEDIRVLSRGA